MRRVDATIQYPKTATGRARRRLFFVLCALVLLFAGHTALWAFACFRLEQGLRDAAAQAPEQGWTVSAEQIRWAGWPASAGLDLDAVTARGETNVFPPGMLWSAPLARLRLRAIHPTELLIQAAGQQRIAAQGLPPIPFQTALFQIAVDLTGKSPVQAVVHDLDATLPAGALRVRTADLSLAPAEWQGTLAGIALPGAPPEIDTLRLRLAATPHFPAATTPAAAARHWRGDGGRVTIDQAAAEWATLRATLDATGGLDPALQPEATGVLVTTGLPEFLDALAASGALTRSSVIAAKAVVTILAAPAAGAPLKLPVALRDGILTVARVPVLRLAPVAWE